MKFQQGVMPKRPYRDSALLYGGFATASLVIVGVTGGELLPRFHPRTDGWPHFVIGALPIVVVCFLIATGYSWWRIRERLETEEEDA
jgi:polyferredoxin